MKELAVLKRAARVLPKTEQLTQDIGRLLWVVRKLKSVRRVRELLDDVESFSDESGVTHAE